MHHIQLAEYTRAIQITKKKKITFEIKEADKDCWHMQTLSYTFQLTHLNFSLSSKTLKCVFDFVTKTKEKGPH